MRDLLKIPKCMSTQHPDNVNTPFFAENTELGGEDEIQEAYYGFSHLGCDEQMWDCEGKEVDSYVVKKLLTKYEPFFREKKLGKDVYLTLRVPNPTVEKAEAKVLLETLESIPRSYDAAKLFYQEDVAPIFEVILPMTSSALDLERVYRYYRDFVVGKQNQKLGTGDTTLLDWIGEFKPEKLNVIPLFEDREHILRADEITREFLKDKTVPYQRVFLARSDPAMNYSLIGAVLLDKIALFKLHKLSKDLGIPICPIVGVGSAPFRGNLRPETVDRLIKGYPSAYNFTIQSAFKYDNHPDEVIAAIEKMEARKISDPQPVDEKRSLAVIDKISSEYREQVTALAPVINRLARFVPSRRKRKLHIGLFGYSRNVGGVSLPRVITFVAALYSIGIPPEILGLNALNGEDLKFLREQYKNFDDDMRDALRFYDPASPFLTPEIKKGVSLLGLDHDTHKEHREKTAYIAAALSDNRTNHLDEYILRAASFRKFLG